MFVCACVRGPVCVHQSIFFGPLEAVVEQLREELVKAERGSAIANGLQRSVVSSSRHICMRAHRHLIHLYIQGCGAVTGGLDVHVEMQINETHSNIDTHT